MIVLVTERYPTLAAFRAAGNGGMSETESLEADLEEVVAWIKQRIDDGLPEQAEPPRVELSERDGYLVVTFRNQLDITRREHIIMCNDGDHEAAKQRLSALV